MKRSPVTAVCPPCPGWNSIEPRPDAGCGKRRDGTVALCPRAARTTRPLVRTAPNSSRMITSIEPAASAGLTIATGATKPSVLSCHGIEEPDVRVSIGATAFRVPARKIAKPPGDPALPSRAQLVWAPPTGILRSNVDPVILLARPRP